MACGITACDNPLLYARGLCERHYRRWAQHADPVPPFPKRDDCPTCAAQRDEHGRLPVGWCSSDCLMARPR